jgi:hypothetical protein
MLQLLVHPNVVKLYDFVELAIKEEKYGLLFMENCSNGYTVSHSKDCLRGLVEKLGNSVERENNSQNFSHCCKCSIAYA